MLYITGATGLLGSHLLAQLAAKHYTLRALKRNDSNLEDIIEVFSYYNIEDKFDDIEWVEGDLNDIPSMYEHTQDVEAIFHCAAMVNFNKKLRKKMFKVNIEGTSNLVNAALANNVKHFCFASSTATLGYELDPNKHITEDTKWGVSKKTTNYALSKYYAEREVYRGMQEGLPISIINPAVIIGPGVWGKSSTTFFQSIFNGLKFYPRGANSFVDVRDVAAMMIHLFENNITSERYVCAAEDLTFKEFFDKISKELRVDAPSIKTTPLMGKIAYVLDNLKSTLSKKPPLITKESLKNVNMVKFFSAQKARKELDWKFIPIDKTIQYTSKHYLQKHKKPIIKKRVPETS